MQHAQKKWKIYTKFQFKDIKLCGHLGDLSASEGIILKRMLRETGYEGVGYIKLVLHGIQRWSLVNLVMNIQAP
jgi:hypothetical protein